jgi:hypothetical protein
MSLALKPAHHKPAHPNHQEEIEHREGMFSRYNHKADTWLASNKASLQTAHVVAFFACVMTNNIGLTTITYYVALGFIAFSGLQLSMTASKALKSSLAKTTANLNKIKTQLVKQQQTMATEVTELNKRSVVLTELVNKGIYDTLVKKALTKQLSRNTKDQERSLLYQVLDHMLFLNSNSHDGLTPEESIMVTDTRDPNNPLEICLSRAAFVSRIPQKFRNHIPPAATVGELRQGFEELTNERLAALELEKAIEEAVHQEIERIRVEAPLNEAEAVLDGGCMGRGNERPGGWGADGMMERTDWGGEMWPPKEHILMLDNDQEERDEEGIATPPPEDEEYEEEKAQEEEEQRQYGRRGVQHGMFSTPTKTLAPVAQTAEAADDENMTEVSAATACVLFLTHPICPLLPSSSSSSYPPSFYTSRLGRMLTCSL